MEMELISPEKEMYEEPDGGQGNVAVQEDKIQEEAQPDHYSKLEYPSQDVYSEAGQSIKKRQTDTNPEEEKPDLYSKLQTTPEDVYAEAVFGHATGKKAGQNGNLRLYRAGCLLLSLLCLILLLVIIVLGVKLQSREDAPVAVDKDSKTCDFQQCRANFPNADLAPRPDCRLCGTGWREFERTCYYFSTYRLDWDESQRNCTARGGTLAVINSKKLQQYLQKNLTRREKLKYWMGLRRKGGEWSWVDNTPLQQSYWSMDDPDKHCGIVDTQNPEERNWIMKHCNSLNYFICQLQLKE